MLVNKKHNVSILFLSFCLGAVSIFAQDTTTINLKEATIIENRYNSEQIGFKQTKTDSFIKSLFNGQQLSDLFSFNNAFFIKSYGTNGIASTSLRGGNATQSVVNWNGFNINNSMLGQADISLLPSFFFDNVSILYGGSSGLNGSGAIGGSVMLKNSLGFNKGITIKAFSDVASYNCSRNGAAFEFSKQKYTSSTKVYFNKGANNYWWGDTINGVYQTQKQTHNKLQQYGLMQQNNFLLTKHQKININVWLQNSDKELPAGSVEKQSKKNQQDWFARTSAQWQLTKSNYALFVRSALFKEGLNYSDSIAAIYSKNSSFNFINEAESKINLSKQHTIDVGIHQTFQKGQSSSYNSSILRYASFASWQYTNKKKWLSAKADARQEFIPTKNINPFTWNIALQVHPVSFIKLYANTGKAFRLPTLNDWYWNPGGNPKLLPEQGYTYEAGMAIDKEIKKFNLNFDVSYFHRNISNWILWLPQTGSIWSPVNLLKVKSEGIESNSSISFKTNKLKLTALVNTNYILSSNQKSVNENDESIGKQLIYTPMYSGSGSLIFSSKQFYFTYNASYTGYRYTSTDNYEYLKPYWIHNISIAYKCLIKKQSMLLYAKCSNLLNTNYIVVLNNPMPLRYFNVGLQITINQIKQ